MTIKRIKYISRFTRAMSVDEVQALADKAAQSNAAQDITGALMTSGGLFFQILEGPELAVDALYARILVDPRHTDVALLSAERVEDRLFPDWGMKAINLELETWRRVEPLRELLRGLQLQRDALQTLSGYLERAVWLELRLQ